MKFLSRLNLLIANIYLICTAIVFKELIIFNFSKENIIIGISDIIIILFDYMIYELSKEKIELQEKYIANNK